MKTRLRFVLLGLVTAAVGEWQFSVFLRGDMKNFVGSLLFNSVYLVIVVALTQSALRRRRESRMLLLLYTALLGLSGLMVEWFLIGNSPWGNPDASQIGMFAYWACIGLVPLSFLHKHRSLHVFIYRFGVLYVVFVLLGQFLITNPDWHFAFHIYAVILGYSLLMISILVKLLRSVPLV